MTVIDDKDLLDEALGRVLEQLKGKTNFSSVLSVFTEQAQELQTALLSLIDLLDILGQEGDQLDGIGAIVGEPRLGRIDFDYQIALLARVRVIHSRGTTEDIYAIMRLVVGTDPVMSIEEQFPAAFVLTVTGEPLADVTHANAILQSSKPVGVGAQLVYQTIDDTTRFTLAPASGTLVTSDSDKGLADSGQTTGGHFAGVV